MKKKHTNLQSSNKVKEELLGILLVFGGEIWVSLTDQVLEHMGRDSLGVLVHRVFGRRLGISAREQPSSQFCPENVV